MRALPSLQSVDEALQVCAQAEQLKVGIISDDRGRIELLYASVGKQAPEVAAEFKRSAIITVVQKIQSQISTWAGALEQEPAELLMQKLPELGRFAASGKLGKLRSEWQALKQSQTERLAAQSEERQRLFSEFREVIPTLPVHFEPDGTAILKKTFDAPEHQEILTAAIEDINGYTVGNRGLNRTCEADLPRTFWEIRTDRGWKSFGLGKADEKRATLEQLFGSDKTALATISKLLQQTAVSLPCEMENRFFPSQALGLLSSDIANDKSTYFRISDQEGNIALEVNTYGKIDRVVILPSMENMQGKTWRTNQTSRFTGEPGPRNFGLNYQLRLLIDREAASRGKLQAIPGTPVEASAEYRLCPVVAGSAKQ